MRGSALVRIFAVGSAAAVLASCGSSRPAASPSPSAHPVTASPTSSETSSATPAAGPFACTLVIGFSQTEQWYLEAPDFEAAVGTDRWELLWNAGAAVELWSNPEYAGWSEPILSPCLERSQDPDRVVFTIGSRDLPLDPPAYAVAIRSAIATTREMFPDLRQIVLQPLVGGPDDGQCIAHSGRVVEASASHPVVDRAIALVIGGNVVPGDSPEVRTCDDYQDSVGHLDRQAEGPIGAEIGAYYAKS